MALRTIETVAIVQPGGYMMVKLSPDIPVGEHRIVVVVDTEPAPKEARPPFELPVFDSGPWPENLFLRREDMYDDWGR